MSNFLRFPLSMIGFVLKTLKKFLKKFPKKLLFENIHILWQNAKVNIVKIFDKFADTT